MRPSVSPPAARWLVAVPLLGLSWLVGAGASLAAPAADVGPTLAEAVALFERGDVRQALALLEPLAAAPGAPVRARALLGALYVEAGRPADALVILGPLAEAADADPAVLYNAGRAALVSGDLVRGEAFLRRSLAAEPTSPAGRELGLLDGGRGRCFESYVLLRPWVRANPEDRSARLAAAYCALQLVRPGEAAELLSGLPTGPMVAMLRGWLLLEEGNPLAAIAELEPLAASAPVEIAEELLRLRARAYSLAGQSARTAELLTGRTRDIPQLVSMLAVAQNQIGEHALALATLDSSKLTTTETLSLDFQLERGRALVGLGRFGEAVGALEAATALAPELPQPWQLLGQAQAALGKRAEARLAMEKFQTLAAAKTSVGTTNEQAERESMDPTGRNLATAEALAASGKLDAALVAAGQEIALAPADVRPPLVLAALLLRSGRPEPALAAVDEALARLPGHPNLLHLRGATLMALERLPEAEVALRQGLAAAPEHPGALGDLATLLVPLNRLDEARSLLEKLVALQPDNEAARQALRDLNAKSPR